MSVTVVVFEQKNRNKLFILPLFVARVFGEMIQEPLFLEVLVVLDVPKREKLFDGGGGNVLCPFQIFLC